MRYARDRLRRESEIQAEIKQLYKDLGCVVVNFSQYRKGSGTHQTLGIPDLKVYCERKGLSWWVEVKTPEGTQSPEQREFQRRALACHETYLLGGIDAVLAHLRRIELVA